MGAWVWEFAQKSGFVPDHTGPILTTCGAILTLNTCGIGGLRLGGPATRKGGFFVFVSKWQLVEIDMSY